MEKRERIIKNIIFLIYIIFGIVLLYFHEPWRDEANTWLIAKNLNFFEILKEVRADGNPCFYYLFLSPFAKLGLPYIFNNIISFTISIVTAYLLLFKTKLNNVIISLFLFSSLFIYYGGIFGRSYCMVNLLFLLITILYQDRNKHPLLFSILVGILFNTHIMLAGFCFSFILIDLYDIYKKKENVNKYFYIGLFIKVVSLLFLIIQLYGCISINTSVKLLKPSVTFFVIMVILFIIFIVILLKAKNSVYFVSLFSFFFQFVGSSFINHYGIYIVNLFMLNILFFLVYFNKYFIKHKYLGIFFLTFFIIMIISRDFIFYYYDIMSKYSDSNSASKYIENNINEDETILCIPQHLCTSVIANSPNYHFVNLYKKEIKYMNYRYHNNDKDIDIDEFLNNNDVKYVIIGYDYKTINRNDYKVIYESKNELIICLYEKYKIYKKIY